ncbi:MAG: DUF1003 domain-containing protein [Chloroflexi bacterium]|nr:DUF1003 domain-containing protein [Chloroflexota bacterium]MCL5075560.1 DUF1003 domain-containing protein [Chloroflexota bacterium]
MAKDTIKDELSRIAACEKRVLDKIQRRKHISQNINVLHEESLTFGERMADRLADLAGSWGLILSFLALVMIWIIINVVEVVVRPWDPYPFILLNLFLSLLAGIQAPVIMMSQNRQEAKDRLRAEHDYEVNLKAEIEIEQLHAKMDLLREKQWQDLVALQQQQIAMLERLLQQQPLAAERADG